MKNIAIRMAAAAVKEKLPPEYAVKFVDLLLEEAIRENDTYAEQHHMETIHNTIHDIVSKFEEKIVPSTEDVVSDIKRELGPLAATCTEYKSIFEVPKQEDDRTENEMGDQSVYNQCLKNFFDGHSFSSCIPLKNISRRYIIKESLDDELKRQGYIAAQLEKQRSSIAAASKTDITPLPTPISQNGEMNLASIEPVKNGHMPSDAPVKPKEQDHMAASAPGEGHIPEPTSDKPLAPEKTHEAASTSSHAAMEPTIYTVQSDAKCEDKAPKNRRDETSHFANKRAFSASASGGSTPADSGDSTNTTKNKKANGTDSSFKSGMYFLAKRAAEGKVPPDLDLDRPKKALGLSYPSRGTNTHTGGYGAVTNEPDSSQPAVPERYLPLLGADVSPELINMVLNMKLDVNMYNVVEEDITGLDAVKKTLKDKVVQPILRPELHTGLLRAPKGVLLFGPPGTGKTTLAKWIANVANANCFEVSPSSITSKFHGESESIIKTLFMVANFDHPSIIFIDEVDAVLGKRQNNEADLSIRMKNQLLQMMDGLHSNADNRVVVVIAATNRPTMLDDAALRRFGKRVLIPLPDLSTRQRFIYDTLRKNCDGKCGLSTSELVEVASATEGWNGSDLMALCMKAAEYSYDDTVEAYGGIDKIPDTSAFRGIVMKDFTRALKSVHPSYNNKGESYFDDWNKQYGSH
ncbi:AAA domain-containing protein [Babesia gibsoni]|uniref:AAA domain-containing protein n=1 Tax=Babesia gibsoni TaxID=33632 RepID=A0AAD8PC72_BABGI|nr:AAA domain-containing protein [Babesia gibsoni]